MDTDDEKDVEMVEELRAAWCPEHKELYRGRIAEVTMAFINAAVVVTIERHGHHEPRAISDTLASMSPVCCWFGAETVDRLMHGWRLSPETAAKTDEDPTTVV